MQGTIYSEMEVSISEQCIDYFFCYKFLKYFFICFNRHGSCPVLLGTKWVINKWYSADDQMFARKCDLTSDA